MKKNIKLILEDGSEFEGYSFGHDGSASGEVVFNTAMTGYPESLTDPSYKGQILVLTYPLIGNYGVPGDRHEDGISSFYESDKIHVTALVISEYSFSSSHWNKSKSLDEWLREHKVPGIYGVDTRALTKRIREKGAMLGKVIFAEPETRNQKPETVFYDPNKVNLVAKVSTREKKKYGNGKYKIILVDCGVKNNIIRRVLQRDTTVIRVPWNYDFTEEEYDGILLSNGPGDPKQCTETVRHIRKAFEGDKPVFGICLGNQLMALAAGADTYKLKYGHRSHNQPVIMKGTNRCFITSQNHGFATDASTLGSDWEELFVNVNDNTNEGIRHKTKPFFSTQYHPEASSGPTDTDFLFDEFLKLVKERSEVGGKK
jgi:carbamoyl-phosphate synthase small subunit